MNRPIAIFSYRRPAYFSRCLEALSKNSGINKIFLFQDGPKHKNLSEQINIEKNIKLFKHYFPNGEIFESKTNLNLAFNQKRGRDFIFSNWDSGIFIEEDVVVNEYYIEMLNLMMDKYEKDAGQISCYGQPRSYPNFFQTLDYLIQDKDLMLEQELNKDKIIHMQRMWAYGMTKSSYEAIEDIMYDYYNLLTKYYESRPVDKISQFMREKYKICKYCITGCPNMFNGNQDSIFSGALAVRDIPKIATFTTNLQYVGKWGTNHKGLPEQTAIRYNKIQTDFLFNEDIKNKILKMLKDNFVYD